MNRLLLACIVFSMLGGVFGTVIESFGSKKSAAAFRVLLSVLMAAAVFSGIFADGLPDLFLPEKSQNADFSALSETQMEAVVVCAQEKLAEQIAEDLSDRYGVTVETCTVKIGRDSLSLERIRIVCGEKSKPFSTYAASEYLKSVFGKGIEVKFE